MTQDEYKRLLAQMVSDVNSIKKSQEFLNILLENLDKPSDKTLFRIELLVSAYLSVVECSLDNLQSDFRKLRRGYNSVITED